MLLRLNSQLAQCSPFKILAVAALIVTIQTPLAVGQETDAPKKPNTKPLKSLFQTDNAPTKIDRLPSGDSQSSKQTIAEIEALRKRMGGGVSERLIGVVPGVNPDDDFRRQLENLTRETPAKPNQSTQPTKPRVIAAPPARQFNFQSSATLAPPKRNIARQPSPQSVLRETAANLERSAAYMESAKLYEQADQLRQLAESFWQKARNLD